MDTDFKRWLSSTFSDDYIVNKKRCCVSEPKRIPCRSTVSVLVALVPIEKRIRHPTFKKVMSINGLAESLLDKSWVSVSPEMAKFISIGDTLRIIWYPVMRLMTRKALDDDNTGWFCFH